jgi:hypothetical protein
VILSSQPLDGTDEINVQLLQQSLETRPTFDQEISRDMLPIEATSFISSQYICPKTHL